LFVRRALLERVSAEEFIDLGDVPVIPHLLHDKYLNEETLNACREALYQDATCQLPVSPLSITEYVCDLLHALPQSPPILGLGGDHSVSYPLVRSWLKNKRAQNKRVAVIHFDAHTDLMERRLGIDLCFATWAYHILELLESPRDLLQYGIRSSGKTKAYWEETLGIQQFWGSELRHNTQPAAQRLHDYLTTQHVEEVYISFDIDAMDESLASATGTPEPDGLNLAHVSDILDAIPSSCQVTGADLVEVAPWVNRTTQSGESAKITQDPTLDTAGEVTAMLLRLLNT
jgi:agmatinase